MTDEQRKYLTDMRSSIDAISYHLGEKRDFFQYRDNLTVKRAVEREIEIIGEATSRLLKVDSNIAITNARKIVVVDIPKLSTEVNLLLAGS